MKFCCDDLNSEIFPKLNQHILYLPQTRTFQIVGAGTEAADINHCPWCGSKFPSDLTDQLINIVYDELKLEGYDDPKLPEQYKSDRWWRELAL